jgi:phage terminase small subunit
MIKMVRLLDKEAEVLADAYKEAKNNVAPRSVFIQDIENMEQGLSRTADHCDIWQDRLIYAMCLAIYHILQWIIRKEKKS